MRSTFMGLEASKRGIFTQQSALYTTGHNVSNVNTPGYSRQRVNMQPTPGYPGVGLNAPQTAGFIGTGVEAGSVQRIRDQFIDQQYRQQSNKFGYWQARSQSIAQMEDVLNEPSEFGLQQSFSLFWKALQGLSNDPENGGARAVTIDQGEALAESFNYMDSSLTQIQRNLRSEIDVTVGKVNSILDQIASLNKQISEVEPNGYLPNDLYDARDTLIDELSSYVPVELSYTKSGGKALAIAEGTVSIKIVGKTILDGVERSHLKANFATHIDGEVSELGPFTNLQISSLTSIADAGAKPAFEDTNEKLGYQSLPVVGEMKALIDSYGYTKNLAATDVAAKDLSGLYPEYIKKLNKLAQEFAKKFNEQHAAGFPKNREVDGSGGELADPSILANPEMGSLKFFINREEEDGSGEITAANIAINTNLKEDASLVRASSENSKDGEEGNGANAKKMSDVQHLILPGLDNASVQMFFEGIIGELGVQGEQAVRDVSNAEAMLESISFNRAAVMSVSLDEEITNMIKFQQAYNASARMLTTIDETLDKVINGMGRVGL